MSSNDGIGRPDQRRLDEPALGVVAAAAEQDLGVGAAPRERDRIRQPAVRALVDQRRP